MLYIQRKKSEHPLDEGATPTSSQVPPVSSVATLGPSIKHQQTTKSSTTDKLGKLRVKSV